jgi:DNA repair exonuclease SbcCD ATPase subunit
MKLFADFHVLLIKGEFLMVLEFNKKIRIAQERVRVKQKGEKQLSTYGEQLEQHKKILRELKETLQMESEDLEKLEGLSITALFLTILGTKEERLRQEKQEVALAKLQYDEAKAEIVDLQEDMATIHMNLQNVQHAEQELKQLLSEKEEYIRVNNSEFTLHLNSLDDQTNRIYMLQQEMDEALFTAEEVRVCLANVTSALEGAKGWGTVDIFGGGIISTAIKHNHLDEARSYMHDAQHLAKKLQNELEDVGVDFSYFIDLSNLARFADYFFDGLITDWVIQNQINDSLEQVRAYSHQVMSIVRKIKAEQLGVIRQLQNIETQKKQLIEQAV